MLSLLGLLKTVAERVVERKGPSAVYRALPRRSHLEFRPLDRWILPRPISTYISINIANIWCWCPISS